ncbi:hypothetical protein HDF16_003302 [Granulicella aggregans]|uniref:Outer membrane lipoprotein-sorting protein n=1 Tax=Granulicella aggregans TaxID=474949 RepID=A0A7W7ZF75_9BACT|nr:hypothetical protein [Granulicella aggregans]MBB5058588.1 hypothetical protein [Granulicella aggregans]
MKVVPKLVVLALTAATITAMPTRLQAQASEIPSAQTAAQNGSQTNGVDQDKRGRILLDQMVAALGGDAWLNRRTAVFHGNTAAFFRGQPNLGSPPFWDFKQFADATHPEADRIEYTKKRDIVQIYTAGNGYEITYKGNKPLPADQVKDYFLRQRHSLESIINVWLKQPGIVVLYEGASQVERRQAEKVTLLGADNDAVTVELDASSHLPLRRTFESRNVQFKDHDEDVEQYDDYHLIQGVMTPLTISRYKNGDLANQRFYLDVKYNEAIEPTMFNTDLPLKAKGKTKN